MDIRCKQTKCFNNTGEVCSLKGIEVSEKADCKNFEADPEKANAREKAILESPPKYAPFKPYNKMKIDCTANCQFNKFTKCVANGITVLRDDDSACCGTFLTPYTSSSSSSNTEIASK